MRNREHRPFTTGDTGATKPVLVITGTIAEAKLAAGPGVVTLAGGGDGARLAAAIARVAPTCCGIISFGTGGGLSPELALGAVVIGARVIAADTDCDPRWSQALAAALPGARRGAIFADGRLLARHADKAAAAATGAVLADMESHLAAAAAARHRLPLAVLRCVSDPLAAQLPDAVGVAMRPDGGLAIPAILASLLRRPGQIPALCATGLGFARSFAALRRAAEAAGPRLGFDRSGLA